MIKDLYIFIRNYRYFYVQNQTKEITKNIVNSRIDTIMYMIVNCCQNIIKKSI